MHFFSHGALKTTQNSSMDSPREGKILSQAVQLSMGILHIQDFWSSCKILAILVQNYKRGILVIKLKTGSCWEFWLERGNLIEGHFSFILWSHARTPQRSAECVKGNDNNTCNHSIKPLAHK